MMVEDLYVEINGVPARKVRPKIPTIPNAIDKLLNRGTGIDRQRYAVDDSSE
jgi:hypothetical protein